MAELRRPPGRARIGIWIYLLSFVEGDAGWRGRLRRAALPLLIGLLIHIPCEIAVVLHQSGHQGQAVELGERLWWICMPGLLLSFEAASEQATAADWTFLAKPIGIWIYSLMNVGYHATLEWWCRYAMTDGYVHGVDTL